MHRAAFLQSLIRQNQDALQGEQQQPIREETNQGVQDHQVDANQSAGAQDQQDLMPDSTDNIASPREDANLFERLEARAQRAREAQPGALRPFRR